jgi:hypothetical protein
VLASLKAHHVSNTGGVSKALQARNRAKQARLLRLSQSAFRAHAELALKV